MGRANESILGDFEDIETLIDNKKKSETAKQSIAIHSNDSDLIQKWLKDRKRWDSIQQSYEEKVIDIETKLKKKMDAMSKQEDKYQQHIKSLNQQIKEYKLLQSKYQCLEQTVAGNDEECKEAMNKLNECQKENERLKELELTSQNMVERLLKRLEQQIHSAESVQLRSDAKQKEHDLELMRLETINSKLQKHLTHFTQCKDLSECSSDSSLFTLSTVITSDPQSNTKQEMISSIALKRDLDAMKKENNALKQTLNAFEQNDQEWIANNKNMAKQTVFIERLKNEIMEKENVINAQKESINNLEHRMKRVTLLQQTNAQISMQLIAERSMRQKLQKKNR